ncbi:MAG: hypothetical protein RIS61_423 [Actinomycetota bacterium]
MVNPSTELAVEISAQLLNAGTKHVVVCPGSRSAPLSWQLASLASEGLITLHTRIDEREAGFLALGLAKATGKPVPVVVTSGTAVANLLPAVVEAHHSGIPLVVLSADRPEKVRGHGAPQTTLQNGMFANFVKATVDTAVPTSKIGEALRLALTNHCGPIQINAQFEIPLMPDDITANIPKIENIEIKNSDPSRQTLELDARGVLVIGDVQSSKYVEQLKQLAENAGYPIIWEPTGQVQDSENALSHGALLLQTGKSPTPNVVISAGQIGLSRSVLGLLKSAKQHIAIHLPTASSDLPDPVLSADQILNFVPEVKTQIDSTWLSSWQSLDQNADVVINQNLSGETLTGPSAAVSIWNQLPNDASLFISPSWPVRHIEMYGKARAGLATFGNRGVNGIDGLISSAAGVAIAKNSRTYLLIGDIAFLHGMGGLNVSEPNQIPDLTVVVLDNDGSGIFSQLEQGEQKYQKHFEQVFGTPHGKDLWVIAESLGVPAVRVTTQSELTSALNRTNKIPGMHVIVCTTGSREDEQAQINQILKELTEAL